MKLFNKIKALGIFAASSSLVMAANPAQAGTMVSGTIVKTDNRTATVDYWKLTLDRPLQGQRTIIDVDAFGIDFGNGASQLDSVIRLFKDDGSLDIDNFERGNNNQNPNLLDSFLSLGRNRLDAGNYILAISSNGFSTEEAVAGSNRVGRNRQGGDYEITFSENVSNVRAVPEPTSMLGIMAIASIGAASIKRKLAQRV